MQTPSTTNSQERDHREKPRNMMLSQTVHICFRIFFCILFRLFFRIFLRQSMAIYNDLAPAQVGIGAPELTKVLLLTMLVPLPKWVLASPNYK